MTARKVAENIFLIENVLSNDECDGFINESEIRGYQEATIETEKGSMLIKDVRNNQRQLFSDEILASNLWNRIKEHVPTNIGKSNAVGLNELFRFYKYKGGEKFKKHIDESFIRNEVEASYYTFMIYLNDGYIGGETRFEQLEIVGKKGMGLIFLHSIPHEGCEVADGIKYVLRTDVMYRLATS